MATPTTVPTPPPAVAPTTVPTPAPAVAPTTGNSFSSSTPSAPPVLPPPLYEIDPILHCRLLRYINNAVGLAPADRLVLGGVLQHLPVLEGTSTTELLSKVQHLDATNLKVLANLFTAGLLDARSWGGSRTASTRSRTGTPADAASLAALTTNAEYNELFRRLCISSPFPPPHAPTERESTTKDRVKRTAKLSRLCLERQHDECPLTADTDIALETAHLVPFSIAAPRRADTAFWLLLAICLGPTLRDHLHSIIHGKNAATTVNGLAMQSVLHKYFDRGAIALEPSLLHTDAAYDASTTTFYDVVFRWRDVLQGLRLRVTMLPLDPAEQISVAPNRAWTHRTLPDERRIEDGNRFRLCTDDPGRLPLPHPFLLSLHARLWSMIQSAGLAETIDRKRKRLDRACERPDADNGHDDDDDDEDDASDPGRKRVHRTKGRSRTRSTKKAKTPASGSTATSITEPHGVSQNNATLGTTAAVIPVDKLARAPTQQMTFLEQEYLRFRLGNPWLEECSNSDTDNEYDSDSDSDTDTTSSDNDVDSDSESGGEEPDCARPTTFLEREWAQFTGRGQGQGRNEGGVTTEEAGC